MPLVAQGAAVHLGGMDLEDTLAVGLEPLLSVQELADYLGLPVQTIYDWRVHGKGPRAHKVGKRIRFAISDIRVWVERQREVAVSTPSATKVG